MDRGGGAEVNNSNAADVRLPFVFRPRWLYAHVFVLFILFTLCFGVVAAHPHFPRRGVRRSLQTKATVGGGYPRFHWCVCATRTSDSVSHRCEDGLGSCFRAAWITFALRIDFVNKYKT